MIVQIYTTQTPEEALALVNAGVDHIGITPSTHDLPGKVSNETARKIVDAIGDKAVKVALTVDSNLQVILEMVSAVQPDILHLCGDIDQMPPSKVAELRNSLRRVKIMQAIPMVGEKAFDFARAYESLADFLLLDSVSQVVEGIGAAGFTHDWNVSREIVKQSQIPVILAGGLSPENVAEAIRVVRPWGVDSLTLTNLSLGNGKFVKDIGRVKQFVDAALIASADLPGEII